MNTLLFDIDGTLINTGGAGQRALKLAFTETFDQPPPESIPTCGRTDRGITQSLYQQYGLTDSVEQWQAFHSAYLKHLTEQLPELGGHLLPGVESLLPRLTSHPEIAIGLLTGNTSRGAQIKLEYFDIFQHFLFGGFGDHHPQRDGVAREAVLAAETHLQQPVDRKRTWVIGDTHLDIQCARHIGAKVIAVTTGLVNRKDLAAEQPDVLLDDLTDTDRLLATFTA